MTVIRVPAVFPNGETFGGEELIVELVTGSSRPGFTGSAHVIGRAAHVLPRDGSELQVDLAPNVGTMAGTVYDVRVEEWRWRIQLPASGEYLVGDPAIAAPPGAPSVAWTPGPPGGTAEVGVMADRPDAGPLPEGQMFFATDDNGGTMWAVVGSEWVQVGPSTADASGLLLQSASAATNVTTPTLTTQNAYYRLPEFTTATFTMPDRPVIVRAVQFVGYATDVSAQTFVLSLRYSLDDWSTSTEFATSGPPSTEGLAPFHLRYWAGAEGFLPVAPGTPVRVAVFVTCITEAGKTMIVTANTFLRPTLYAQAL